MYLPYFHITLTLTGVVNWLLAFVGLQALTPLVVYLIDALVILLGIVMPVVTILIYLLRKFLGFIQRRLGPMRTGPLGVLQTVADGLKLFHKEDIVPAKADRVVFALAPYLVFLPAIMVYVVIPFGRGQGFITKDLNIGLVYITAVSSITAIGILCAGWASDNRWSLLGGLRSAAQLVSYELPMTLGLLGPALLAGSLSLGAIVEAQRQVWFVVPQALAFLIYFIAALAEVCHIPFDLPEAEQELVAGYNTEYSSMRFGLFFMGEFANDFTIAGVAVTLFFGGWHLLPGWDPLLHLGLFSSAIAMVLVFVLMMAAFTLSGRRVAGLTSATDWNILGIASAMGLALAVFVASLLGFASVVVFLTKTSLLVFVLIWLRGTLPRVRVDQLMSFGWKVLVPLGLVNFLAVAFQAATDIPTGWFLNLLFIAFVLSLPVWAWRKKWAYSDV